MLHSTYTFSIYGKVVIEMCISFDFGQLCNRETTRLVYDRYIYQTVFAQHEDKIRLYVATFTIIFYDNEFVQHDDRFLVVLALP